MQDAQHIVHAKTNHYLFDKTKSGLQENICVRKTLRVCISMLRNYQISVEGKRKERDKLLAMSENKLHHQM